MVFMRRIYIYIYRSRVEPNISNLKSTTHELSVDNIDIEMLNIFFLFFFLIYSNFHLVGSMEGGVLLN